MTLEQAKQLVLAERRGISFYDSSLLCHDLNNICKTHSCHINVPIDKKDLNEFKTYTKHYIKSENAQKWHLKLISINVGLLDKDSNNHPYVMVEIQFK